jgi:glycosyltransferase involved in cell wall biosynthesis
MMSKSFSIIIPTFNSAKTLSKAFDSILCQTFSDYEIIVVDGRSTDGTIEIIKSYAEKNACISWLSENDKGIYDAMNKGIKKAKGEWILFLGSDDTLYNNQVLALVFEGIGNNKNSRMIYGDVQLNKPIGFEKESLTYGGEFHTRRLLYANICHQSIFYNQSVFRDFGLFNINYKLLADWDFNLRCFNLVNPVYLDLIISNFFVGASSMQSQDDLFKEDLVKNMALTYPYSYRHSFFHKRKKDLLQLLQREISSLRIYNSCKILRVLLYSFQVPK